MKTQGRWRSRLAGSRPYADPRLGPAPQGSAGPAQGTPRRPRSIRCHPYSTRRRMMSRSAGGRHRLALGRGRRRRRPSRPPGRRNAYRYRPGTAAHIRTVRPDRWKFPPSCWWNPWGTSTSRGISTMEFPPWKFTLIPWLQTAEQTALS